MPPSESRRPYNRDTMKTQSKIAPSYAGAHRPNDRRSLPPRSALIAGAFVAVVVLLVATRNLTFYMLGPNSVKSLELTSAIPPRKHARHAV